MDFGDLGEALRNITPEDLQKILDNADAYGQLEEMLQVQTNADFRKNIDDLMVCVDNNLFPFSLLGTLFSASVEDRLSYCASKYDSPRAALEALKRALDG